MGRKLRRVALNFVWPIDKVWEGFVRPDAGEQRTMCAACDGTGESPEARRLHNLWYGKGDFHPEDRGSTPFTPADPHIRKRAENNCARAPRFYGATEDHVQAEVVRLCGLFNARWACHLNDDDVAALISEGRLVEFTHDFVKGQGWVRKSPAVTPTAREVNIWQTANPMGHDGINEAIVVRAEMARLNLPWACESCDGEGEHWASAESKAAYDSWMPYEPPSGPGYQLWETVTEGSPITPVFETAEKLAQWLSVHGDHPGTTAKQWLQFLEGVGASATLVIENGEVRSGVQDITTHPARVSYCTADGHLLPSPR